MGPSVAKNREQDLHASIDEAISAVAKARKAVASNKSKQVTSAEERDLIKTVASFWFRNIRLAVYSHGNGAELAAVDEPFKRLLDCTAKATTRTSYVDLLKTARKMLLKLRESLPAVPSSLSPMNPTSDNPPNFSSLASDQRMQSIMERRWAECVTCINNGAFLAAAVMMGGLLESLFISRQNQLTDKSSLIKAKRAPQSKGKTLPLQEWTLNHYIEVGNELGWIGDAAKRVGIVLRDYRNFIHPQTEYAQQVVLTEQDARVMWDVTKSLTRELLSGASP
ncbi:MAG TPA: hypothetical protein VM658_09870 [bacterium]|nr:hypothetical protein [bacterium]